MALSKLSNKQALFVILICSFLVWLPSRQLPYHWDSAGYVITTARNIQQTNFRDLLPTHGQDIAYAHPPLWPLLLALSWQLFGHRLLVSHLMMAPFLPMLVVATYYLALKLVNNPRFGLSAAVLLGLVPVAISEYYLTYLDLPMAALTVAGFTLWLYGRRWLAGACLALAVLTKVPALMIFPAIIAYEYFQLGVESKSRSLAALGRRLLPLCLPLLALASWLIYHYQSRGWVLVNQGLLPTAMSPTLAGLARAIMYELQVILLDQGRWLLLAVAGVLLLRGQPKTRQDLSPEVKSLLVYLSCAVIGYAPLSQFGQRYSLFILPVSFLLILVYIWHQLSLRHYLFVVVAVAVVFLTHLRPTEITAQPEYRGPQDLSSLDMIKIGKAAAQYVEQQEHSLTVIGSFPESYQLTQPHQGYVTAPINFLECSSINGPTVPNPQQTYLVYKHWYSPNQQNCHRLIQHFQANRVQRFQSGGKWLELYILSPQATNSNENEP